jgi:YbgC/YbaW family acyl-CoA thioester hydrolase
MPYEFKVTRRVEFSDTDMAGIMHFSNFFRFMETAEHAFFRSLGHSVVPSQSGLRVHLPRVHAQCDYVAPLRFEDEVLIHLLVQKKGRRSLTYQFHFHRLNGPKPQEVARGRLTVVSTVPRSDGTFRAVVLPKVLSQKIQEAPPRLLANSSPRRQSKARTPRSRRLAAAPDSKRAGRKMNQGNHR